MNHYTNSLIERWQVAAGGRKIVLHIGCGSLANCSLYSRYTTSEWHEIRVDPAAETTPDLVADVCDLSAIPDQSIDAIWVNQNLGQIEPHEVTSALAECNRILKEHGEMGACVPDLPAIAMHIANGKLEEPIYTTQNGLTMRPLDLVYGCESDMVNGTYRMAYRTGYSAESLIDKIRAADFSAITVMRKELHLWLGSFKYPSAHPKRAEKPRIIIDKAPENLFKLSMETNNRPGMLTDELNVPPKMWDML